MVRRLLGAGADPNARAKTAWIYDCRRYPSVLYAACANGHEAAIELLLKRGANLHHVHEGYGNVLLVASFEGYGRLVRALIERGTEINAPGFDPSEHKGAELANSLHAASYRGHTHIVQLLLDKGADVNSQGGHYGTALQAACAKGAEGAAMLLLNNGADINVQSGHFGNAVQAALAEGEKRLAQILFRRGAYIDTDRPGYMVALRNSTLFHGETHEILQDNSERGQKRRHSDIAECC